MIWLVYLVSFLAGLALGYLFVRYAGPKEKPIYVGPDATAASNLKAEISALQKDVMDLRVVVVAGHKDAQRMQAAFATSADTILAAHVESRQVYATLAGQIEKTAKDIAHGLGLEAEAATLRLRRDVEGAAVATAAFVDSAITKLGARVSDVAIATEAQAAQALGIAVTLDAARKSMESVVTMAEAAGAEIHEIASAPGHVKAAVQEIAALRQRLAKVADEVESEVGQIAKHAVSETGKVAAQASANIDGLRKRASAMGSGKDPIVVPPVKIVYTTKSGRILGEEFIPANQRRPTRTFNERAYVASQETAPGEWIYVRG